MAIKAVYQDPRREASMFDGNNVELTLNEDGAIQSVSIAGQQVDVSGLRSIIADSKSTEFEVTIRWADGRTEGPFSGVQHIESRVNYGMNVVELLQFERLQRIWYSQKAPAAVA